jgi:hypothetical protein
MLLRSLSLLGTRLYQLLELTVDTNALAESFLDSKQLQDPIDTLRKTPVELVSYLPPPYIQPFNFPKKKG